MEELILKIILVLLIILVSYKLMFESIWESFKDDSNLRKAKKELPLLANELKLKFKKGDGLGIYRGHWNNHKIRIEPNYYDTSIGITTIGEPYFSAFHKGISKKRFHINTLFHYLTQIIIMFIPDYPKDESKSPAFSFGNQQLDKYFKIRRLSGDEGKEIACNPELIETIKLFIKKNNKLVKNLHIGDEVSCSLWLGSSSMKSRLYSVTGKQVKFMLSELYPIVEALDKALKKQGRILNETSPEIS